MATKGTQNGSTVSLADAEAQMAAAQAALETARSAGLASAKARLAEIDAERATVQAQIKSLGGTVRKGGRKSRASNEVSLITAVAQSLTAKRAQTTTQICEKVKKNGYNTTAENYPTMVAQSLSKLANLRMGKSPVCVRVDRGQYQAGSGMDAYLANPEDATVVDGE